MTSASCFIRPSRCALRILKFMQHQKRRTSTFLSHNLFLNFVDKTSIMILSPVVRYIFKDLSIKSVR